MAFEELSLKDYLQILYRRRRVILVVFLASLVFTVLIAFNQENIFRAESRIKIQRQRTLADFMSRLQQARPVDTIENYLKEITSYRVMQRVARSMYPEDPDVDRRAANLQEMIQVERLGNTDLIDIRVESTSGQEAMEIANAVSTTFIQYHQENITRNARQVKEQIEEWRNQIMTQLYSDERALKDFREKYGVVDLEAEGDNLTTQISNLRSQKIRIENELSQLEGRIRKWKVMTDLYTGKTQPEGGQLPMEAAGMVPDSRYLTGVKTRIFDLHMTRTEVMGTGNYTTNHPRMELFDIMLQSARKEAEEERRRIVMTRMEELENERAGLQAKRQKIEQQIDAFKEQLQQIPELERESRKYVRRKDVSETLYTFLSQKLEEAKISELERAEIAYVVSPAMTADEIRAGQLRTTVAGLLLGLVLGVAMAFVAENLDTTIATLENVEQLFKIPVMGVIPHIEREPEPGQETEQETAPKSRLLRAGRALLGMSRNAADYIMATHSNVRSPHGIEMITQFDPKSPGAEAFRTIRTNLEYYSRNTGAKVFLLSSAAPAEGKTVTLTNTAVALAQLGRRVLVVGANLRRPSFGRLLGISEERGLSDFLLGDEQWTDVVKDMTDFAVGDMNLEDLVGMPGLDNLNVITSGGVAAQPSEWLANEKMVGFLNDAREQYDYILIDSPPVLPVPDSVILGRLADAVILVYQLGQTTRESMRRAIVSFRQTDAHLAGLVLNDLQADWAAGGEFFQYRFYYGRDGQSRMPWERNHASHT
ncbi:GumC family protein [Kiritimatiella glycovorans]|uniref:non-specific protein-tyrosine kinase n=1 Tax=Kiritimatiella glycovorans TaxID=1307763 RepID=A0A0G3EFC6_9BACT|nr:polysaccharide biosynthesis tyrosine autokinase [Kiritimatiella glycovorans]AKJ63485.1 Tyrosine-protein kinase YwqD [Kiritimatiella glycovorans]